MKTKEQVAQEYAEKNYPKCKLNEDWVDDGFDEGYNAAANPTAYKSFLAGVEFANKWISIDEELPPIGEVGSKRKGIKYLVKYIKDGKYDYSLSEYTKYGFENCVNVIAWRLIEL